QVDHLPRAKKWLTMLREELEVFEKTPFPNGICCYITLENGPKDLNLFIEPPLPLPIAHTVFLCAPEFDITPLLDLQKILKVHSKSETVPCYGVLLFDANFLLIAKSCGAEIEVLQKIPTSLPRNPRQ